PRLLAPSSPARAAWPPAARRTFPVFSHALGADDRPPALPRRPAPARTPAPAAPQSPRPRPAAPPRPAPRPPARQRAPVPRPPARQRTLCQLPPLRPEDARLPRPWPRPRGPCRRQRSSHPRRSCVASEDPRGGELAELVTDHRLADEHRHVLFAVVHGDRVADHLREDRRRTRPRPQHFLVVGGVQGLDPGH